MVNHPKMRPEVLFRLFAFLTLIVLGSTFLVYNTSSQTKMPDTITLAKEAKLGPVTFNHLKHATEKRSPDGTKTIECVECHHTAQPAAEAVKNGVSVLIFPEGTRSQDGKLQPFKKGVFLIALKSQAPILPITIQGTSKILRKGDWRTYPGNVRITIDPKPNGVCACE